MIDPILPTYVEETWGGLKFVPVGFDSREAEPWARFIWAKFVDLKPIAFQPKDTVSGTAALLHIKACFNTEGVPLARRLMACAWLCSQWFESAEILDDTGLSFKKTLDKQDLQAKLGHEDHP